jgi:hypothetical protein
MGRFEYQERSADTVRQRAKQTGGDYDSYFVQGTNVLKVKEGENTYRILPVTWDVKKWGDNWGIECWVHYNIGPDNASYLCPKKMLGKPCCLCEEAASLDKEDAKAIKAKKRIICYAIDRDNEKAGVQVWGMGWQAERDLQVRSQDKKSGAVLKIDHPEKGYDISFTREGTGKNDTRYFGWDIARKPSFLSDDEEREQKWLKQIEKTPLPEVLVFHDQDYIQNVYDGKAAKFDDDDDEDDRPKRRGRSGDGDDDKPKRRRASEDDDDDRPKRRRAAEEEDEEDRPKRRRASEEDEEEDEKPKRRRASEDDDDDDRPKRRRAAEEEDDDEKPKRRRASSEEDEDEDKPKRRRAAADEDDELPDDDQMRRNSRRSRASEDDDDDKPKRRRASEEDEEEEDKPKRRRSSEDEEDDDKPKRRRAAEDEEDEDKPKRRASAKEEDEEEEGDPKASARKQLDKLRKPGGLKRK